MEQPKPKDVNERLQNGTLPFDPAEGASPMGAPESETRAKVVRLRRRRLPKLERGDHAELAEHLVSQLAEVGPVVFDVGDLFRYDPTSGIWRPVDVAEQSGIVQAMAGAEVECDTKPLRIDAQDVAGAAKLAHHRVTRAHFFADATPGLAFANVFVHVDSSGLILRPHSPEHRARAGYPFAFRADASASRWQEFLGSLFRDDADKGSKIDLLQEFFGASLLGVAARYQRAIVAIGSGANGKSTTIEVIQHVMPLGVCATIPPQQWHQEYRRAKLAGVRFNAVSELPEADIIDSEPVKAIISGDAIDARHIRQDPFSFRPTAGHFFAANRLPATNDSSDGFWRRLIVIRFGRRFAPAEQNPRLATEIVEAERPGIIRWMLDGAHRLLATNAYTEPASAAEELEKWRLSSNSVATFVTERVTRGGWTPARRLYKVYRDFCSDSGFRAVSIKVFNARMTDLNLPASDHHDGHFYPLSLSCEASVCA